MSSKRSLGYAHTQDVGGGHCAALLGAFKAFCEGSGAGPAAPELDRVLEVAFQVQVDILGL